MFKFVPRRHSSRCMSRWWEFSTQAVTTCPGSTRWREQWLAPWPPSWPCRGTSARRCSTPRRPTSSTSSTPSGSWGWWRPPGLFGILRDIQASSRDSGPEFCTRCLRPLFHGKKNYFIYIYLLLLFFTFTISGACMRLQSSTSKKVKRPPTEITPWRTPSRIWNWPIRGEETSWPPRLQLMRRTRRTRGCGTA